MAFVKPAGRLVLSVDPQDHPGHPRRQPAAGLSDCPACQPQSPRSWDHHYATHLGRPTTDTHMGEREKAGRRIRLGKDQVGVSLGEVVGKHPVKLSTSHIVGLPPIEIPRAMSCKRVKPRQTIILPGGGSWLQAR